MAYKVYLSAAAHATDNATRCPTACSENKHCAAYMDIVETRLKALGVSVKRGSAQLTGAAALTARVKEANQWRADIYYVAHTNAGGGRYSMTMCWPDAASRAKAAVLHKHRRSVSTHKVVTNDDLYEINATAMTCLYDELFFHDNAEDCAWFHREGMAAMAEETVAALCELGGIPYTPPAPPADTAPPANDASSAKPQAGDKVTLRQDKLYLTARGNDYVTRTGTFYLYDGVLVGQRYRVTNHPSRVNKEPLSANVSGWVKL